MGRRVTVTATDRVAVVTGGGRGIGRGIALALADMDLAVVIGWSADEASALATAAEIDKKGVPALCLQGDVGDPGTSAMLARVAESELGRLAVWVNNAGVSVLAPLVETTPEAMARMVEVNLLGTFRGTQTAAATMVAAGRGGRIVNIASDLGIRAAPLLAGYSATKFGVVGLTQAAAIELAPSGITVNAVCPGTVETDMVLAEEAAEARLRATSPGDVHDRLLAAVPAARLCTPEDVASLVTWLAGDDAGHVTGQAICSNGGSILH
jgi:meso-butanediol dehydrogenase/(S,S)-butanediol dehydrogenase/diacetyl reductase